MASKIELVSNALILIGDVPINTLDGDDRRQTIANNLYDNIVKFELSKHRWSFARRLQQLSLLTAIPISEYSHSYQLPSDLITLIKIDPAIDYEIYGTQVYCNFNQALYADYIYSAPESEWTPSFAKMIEYALARDFATSLRDSSTLRGEMAAEYENASRMARYSDAQQRPQRPIVSRPFIDVRS